MARRRGLPEVLLPADVADVFGVDPKTVTRWAKAGKIRSFCTVGGHRRYRRADVQELLADQGLSVQAIESLLAGAL